MTEPTTDNTTGGAPAAKPAAAKATAQPAAAKPAAAPAKRDTVPVDVDKDAETAGKLVSLLKTAKDTLSESDVVLIEQVQAFPEKYLLRHREIIRGLAVRLLPQS